MKIEGRKVLEIKSQKSYVEINSNDMENAIHKSYVERSPTADKVLNSNDPKIQKANGVNINPMSR